VATHVIRLVQSHSAQEQDFDLVVMKMTADAGDLAARFEGACLTTNANQGEVEICITEGARGPSLQEYKRHMEPSFVRHCSGHFPEIDLPPRMFTK
jgi:hypothetical protein